MEFRFILKNGDEFVGDYPSKQAAAEWLEECGYMRAKSVAAGSIDRHPGNALKLWYATREAIAPAGARL